MGRVGLKCGIAQPLTAHDMGALEDEGGGKNVHSVRILGEEVFLRGVESLIKNHRATYDRRSKDGQGEVVVETVPNLPLQDLDIIRLDRNEQSQEGGRKNA